MKRLPILIAISILTSCEVKQTTTQNVFRKQYLDTIWVDNTLLINNWSETDTLYAEYDSSGKLIKVILNP